MLQIPVFFAAALLIFTVIFRWTLKNEEEKKNVDVLVSPQATMANFNAFQGELSSNNSYNDSNFALKTRYYECAVCSNLTSTRCSRCKAVRYCSSKCQIIHWRQGHKFECNPQVSNAFERDYLNDNAETMQQRETNCIPAEDFPRMDEKNKNSKLNGEISDSPVPRLSTVTNDSLDIDNGRSLSSENGMQFPDVKSSRGLREDKTNTSDTNSKTGSGFNVKNLNRGKSRQNDKRKSRLSNTDLSPGFRQDNSSDRNVPDNIDSSRPKEVPLVDDEGQKPSHTVKHENFKSLASKSSSKSLLPSRSSSSSSQIPYNGFKVSFQKVVHLFKTSHQKKPPPHNSLIGILDNRKYKAVFQYDAFLKLYSCNDVELKPFGLTNCGNSCYANAVLQCLAYTRPLTMYLLQGLHSKECWKEKWCFVCEFEHLMLKGKEGYTPLSPIRILSNITHLGHGREEDAHEFLRYAVDSMQSVCVELAGLAGSVAEESTLVGMTFVGYLHSKIRCMKCHFKSEIYERMMDLTVEIEGDIRTLEQALKRFTASEMLEGDNKYYCSRCKSYEKAKKKLTVFQAPNILTIMLKRFQAENFTKLRKPVKFPEILNMTPYMSHSSDKDPQYSLYAVVVHLDVSSPEFSGHYVCYVKTYSDEWFKIDDSVVVSVDLERVLSVEAYMLLYARNTPRMPSSVRSFYDGKLSVMNFAADSAGHSQPKIRHSGSDVGVDPLVMQRQSSKSGYAKDPSFVEEWVTHSVESIPRVDSSSEVSSLFSYSEEGTCSTPSTKDSVSMDDFSDYLFGRGGVAGH
ncbi:ubiquitin carboxyl-terminal hydrolase 17-like [Amaranthus tricolor]|uniref:ubiquitin carboxyl-terminal hydrolase 17-like n=1 Tax=Amaranthus tricolor TaxID=29722 RepID=UPI00259060B3|nr:ubiquitin carboxyl-terminal hydrolase 17-like [Amaranthus tricolor]